MWVSRHSVLVILVPSDRILFLNKQVTAFLFGLVNWVKISSQVGASLLGQFEVGHDCGWSGHVFGWLLERVGWGWFMSHMPVVLVGQIFRVLISASIFYIQAT